MAAYSARAQPFLDAIAASVFASEKVRNWLISGTPAERSYFGATVLIDAQRSVRGITKQPFWANYHCGRDARCHCRIAGSKALESDAIFFLKNASGQVLAIHIEFKHPKERFGFGQPESYPLRAACFAATYAQRKTLNAHDDWTTVLFCDEQTLSDPRLVNFQRVITHAQAKTMIGAYPPVGDVKDTDRHAKV